MCARVYIYIYIYIYVENSESGLTERWEKLRKKKKNASSLWRDEPSKWRGRQRASDFFLSGEPFWAPTTWALVGPEQCAFSNTSEHFLWADNHALHIYIYIYIYIYVYIYIPVAELHETFPSLFAPLSLARFPLKILVRSNECEEGAERGLEQTDTKKRIKMQI